MLKMVDKNSPPHLQIYGSRAQRAHASPKPGSFHLQAQPADAGAGQPAPQAGLPRIALTSYEAATHELKALTSRPPRLKTARRCEPAAFARDWYQRHRHQAGMRLAKAKHKARASLRGRVTPLVPEGLPYCTQWVRNSTWINGTTTNVPPSGSSPSWENPSETIQNGVSSYYLQARYDYKYSDGTTAFTSYAY